MEILIEVKAVLDPLVKSSSAAFAVLVLVISSFYSCTHQGDIEVFNHSEGQALSIDMEDQGSINQNNNHSAVRQESSFPAENAVSSPDPFEEKMWYTQTYTHPLELPESLTNISVFFLDQDDLWIGTWTGGVFRWSIPLAQLEIIKEPVESLNVNSTYRIFNRGSNRIWLAGYNWFSYYHKGNGRVVGQSMAIPGRIRDFLIFEDQYYMATAGAGIYRWNKQKGSWLPDGAFAAAGMQINGLKIQDDGFWILTTDHGLFFWDGSQLHKETSIAPNLNVTAVEEWNQSCWIGSYGKGLMEKRIDGSIVEYSEKMGNLSDDWILCTLATEDYLFCGTLGGGIQLFDKGGKSALLSLQEGLRSMDIAALAWYNHHLYIGTLGGGISVIHENLIQYQLQNS